MNYYDSVDWRGYKFPGGASVSGRKTITNPDAWAALTTYATSSEVVATSSVVYKYVATLGGISDTSTSQPTFPTTIDDTVSDGTVLWTCASLAQQVTATSTDCSEVTILANSGNGGIVYIGDSNMNIATRGYPLAASGQTPMLKISNLNSLYAIASTSTDGIAYIGSN